MAWAREALIDIKHVRTRQRTPSRKQHSATFIAEGHLARHIRRMRPIYAQRRRALEKRRAGALGELHADSAGERRAASEHANPGAGEVAGYRRLRNRASSGALPLSSYSAGPAKRHGLCIGYGGVEVDQIASAVRALGLAMRAANRRR